jgi:collagen type VI alpha
MEYEAFGNVTNFVKDMAQQFKLDGDRVRLGVMYFSDNATVWYKLQQTVIEDFSYSMDNMPYVGGKTNTANALGSMRKDVFSAIDGDRPNVPNYCIMITDGIPNVRVNATVQEAIQARIDGTHIIVVTVGKGLDTGRNYLNLHGIASEPVPSNFFNVDSFKKMGELVPLVSGALCNGEKLCFATVAVCSPAVSVNRG